MIYLENTTDTQVIFIDREIQSVKNISPITLDSNYYTKTEVNEIAQRTLEQSKEYTNNLANEYYDIAEEYIDSNIERLENRIDELEINGGGSSGGDNIVYIETDENGLISEEVWLEIVNNPNKTYRIIIYKECFEENNKTYCQINYVEITSINTEEYPELEDENGNKYYDCLLGEVGGVYFGTQYGWMRGFGENGYEMYFNRNTFASSSSIGDLQERMYGAEVRIDDLEGRVYSIEINGGGSSGGDTTELENRVTDIENRAFNNVNSLEAQIEALDYRVVYLENNGGGSSEGGSSNLLNYVYFADSNVFRKDNINGEDVNIEEWLKGFIQDKGAFNNNIINIIYKLNGDYPNYIGETFRLISFVKENVNAQYGYYTLTGQSDNKKLTIRFSYNSNSEIGNYNFVVTETDTTNLQAQIEANNTKISSLEQVKIINVSNGMTTSQFNTIFNNFKTKNYKYLLNVGNNDFFNICSIQDANRSITAIGFDDYEGELMCYNWFAPQIASVPELTKRKIITEIV